MRKRFKIKKKSCPICKPSKAGWSNRWKKKELVKLEDFEKEKKSIIG